MLVHMQASSATYHAILVLVSDCCHVGTVKDVSHISQPGDGGANCIAVKKTADLRSSTSIINLWQIIIQSLALTWYTMSVSQSIAESCRLGHVFCSTVSQVASVITDLDRNDFVLGQPIRHLFIVELVLP